MATPISNASELNEKKILKSYISEYTNLNPFKPFMGKEMSGKPIVVKSQAKGAGDSVVFSLLAALTQTTQSGSGVMSGNEENQAISSFKITMTRKREGVKDDETDFTQMRSPIAWQDAMRGQLADKQARSVAAEIATALGDTTGIATVQDRVLYGDTEGNYSGVLATDLAKVDSTADKLDVATIQRIKLKATTPTSAKKIRPAKIKNDNGMVEEFFIYFAHPTSVFDLKQSTEWKEIAYREGLQQSSGRVPSIMRGSRYVATIDNVIIYQIDELTAEVESGAGASSIDVAHNMLVGADAVAYATSDSPMFTVEERDHKTVYAMAVREMRAIEKITFDSVDNGIIHNFVSAA